MFISTAFLCKSVFPCRYCIPYFHVKNLQEFLVTIIYRREYVENSTATYFLTLLNVMNLCNMSVSVATTLGPLHTKFELFSALCNWSGQARKGGYGIFDRLSLVSFYTIIKIWNLFPVHNLIFSSNSQSQEGDRTDNVVIVLLSQMRGLSKAQLGWWRDSHALHVELQPQLCVLSTEVIIRCAEIKFRSLFWVRENPDNRRNHTPTSTLAGRVLA